MPAAAVAYGLAVFFQMLGYPASQQSRQLIIFTWVVAGRFHVTVSLLVDQLSICFVLLITGVGSLIHLFAVGYLGTKAFIMNRVGDAGLSLPSW